VTSPATGGDFTVDLKATALNATGNQQLFSRQRLTGLG